MFCKECGTENLDSEIECKKCSLMLNDNLPLNAMEKVKILLFFSILLVTFFGILPIIFILISIYVMQKDKKINQLKSTKEMTTIYFSLVAISWFIFGILIEKGFISIMVGLISLFMIIVSDNLFFDICEKHKNWIMENGLFADFKGEKFIFTRVIKKMQQTKKEPIYTTDELLKWAELKEKGLITADEFQKIKEKFLEGRL